MNAVPVVYRKPLCGRQSSEVGYSLHVCFIKLKIMFFRVTSTVFFSSPNWPQRVMLDKVSGSRSPFFVLVSWRGLYNETFSHAPAVTFEVVRP